MDSIINKLRETAKRSPKRIVFPEANDDRVVEATK
ncbi:MAG: hypothetical protein JSV34_06210, partial [Candidatus Omnitrophota bacterium]